MPILLYIAMWSWRAGYGVQLDAAPRARNGSEVTASVFILRSAAILTRLDCAYAAHGRCHAIFAAALRRAMAYPAFPLAGAVSIYVIARPNCAKLISSTCRRR